MEKKCIYMTYYLNFCKEIFFPKLKQKFVLTSVNSATVTAFIPWATAAAYTGNTARQKNHEDDDACDNRQGKHNSVKLIKFIR